MAYEWLFLHCPDEVWFRKPLPPPLDYPDPYSVPDTTKIEYTKTDTFKHFYDAGVVEYPQYTIKDGKKVYDKLAGLNKPAEFI